MPYSVKGLLEVYEDMVEILLMLQVFLTEDLEMNICSQVLLSALKSACSSAIISSACVWSLFRMIFSMTLTRMADKADGSVVLAQLQVAFLWECDN